MLLVLKCICVLFVISGCVQKFEPPEISSGKSYLVVDGFLNFGEDSTKIMLSRTQNTNNMDRFVTENNAQMESIAESGEVYRFVETTSGTYQLESELTNQDTKYKLNIRTTDGNEYESDFVSVDKTPVIDSIGYKVDLGLNAVIFQVNTHDSQNKTHFYRWKFEETWRYRTQHYSSLEVVGTGNDKEIVLRQENINTCYSSAKSTSIILGSTIRMSEDVIKDLPIHRVSIHTNKLLERYSILVRQYGLSREAFEYWTNLSKTTQGTGTLFDPLPSQVTGNIRNKKDAQELVFGFFSAVVEQKKRIFVSPRLGRLSYCPTDTIPVNCYPGRQTDCAYETAGLILYYLDPRQQNVIIADAQCADCRLQGGTTKMPSFWEQ